MANRKARRFSFGCVSPDCINKDTPCSSSKWAHVYSSGKTFEQVTAELAANTSDKRQPPVAQRDGFVWQLTGSTVPINSERHLVQNKSDGHQFVTKLLPVDVTASGEPKPVCHAGYQVRTRRLSGCSLSSRCSTLDSTSPTLFSEASFNL